MSHSRRTFHTAHVVEVRGLSTDFHLHLIIAGQCQARGPTVFVSQARTIPHETDLKPPRLKREMFVSPSAPRRLLMRRRQFPAGISSFPFERDISLIFSVEIERICIMFL